MKKPLILIVTILVAMVGCKIETPKLQDYKEINQVFDQKEIVDLKKIVSFFEKSICEIERLNGGDDVSTCYQSYFKRMKHDLDRGEVEFKIPYEDQNQMIKGLSQSTIGKIWNEIQVPGKDDTFRLYKQESKYQNFLQEFGKENSKIKTYQERFRELGDFSPFMVSDVIMDYEMYDISDERVKLFMAVHYLTVNDLVRVQELMNYK